MNLCSVNLQWLKVSLASSKSLYATSDNVDITKGLFSLVIFCAMTYLPCPLYFLKLLLLCLFIVEVIGFFPCEVPLIVGS